MKFPEGQEEGAGRATGEVPSAGQQLASEPDMHVKGDRRWPCLAGLQAWEGLC